MRIDGQQKEGLGEQDQASTLTLEQRARLTEVAIALQGRTRQLLDQAVMPGPDGACARQIIRDQEEGLARIEDAWARVFCPARRTRRGLF